MTEDASLSLPDPAPDAKPQKKGEDSFSAFLLKLALFVFILRSFIIAPFSIPSESMLPRLLVGDYLVVAKWPYGYSKHSLPFSIPLIPGRIFSSLPVPGDVAVFKAPPGNQGDYIKRVIGLPGDMIQMKEGVLHINGQAVKKERIADAVIPVSPNTGCEAARFEMRASDGSAACHYPRFRETLPNGRSYEVLDMDPAAPYDTTDIYTVPEGHFFAMGDNRDHSADSRFPAVEGQGIGFVPQENLVGRALVMVFSTDGSAEWLKPWTWFTAARWSRIGGGF
jgi:signal peptidase I